VDAFSGVAGDMFLAALLDLGVPMGPIESALGCLPLQGYHTHVETLFRSGIKGCRFQVSVDDGQPQRDYREIRRMLEQSELPRGGRSIALQAFRLLAEAEAQVHGALVDDVHFHEVGAVDSIVDIVGVAVALDWLAAPVISSPLPMGRGLTRSQHGVLPLPAPATVTCLRGVPTCDAGIEGELVTPTGACLVASVAEGYARWPALCPERVGWGCGSRELPDRPNLLRLVLGSPVPQDSRSGDEAPFVVLETNVDDTTPELAAHAVERALQEGALDAWTTAIGMKKGRPAVMISALVRRAGAEAVTRVLLQETSSLGVRLRAVDRVERPRRIVTVRTRFGEIPVKVASGDGLSANIAPEFEACREAAKLHRVPLKDVYAAAIAAAARSGGDDARDEP
jgi:uncharacterized protein (TIGR00299 family) protein